MSPVLAGTVAWEDVRSGACGLGLCATEVLPVPMRHCPYPFQRGSPRPSTVAPAISGTASSAAVSVLESCANQSDLRLTLLRPSDEEDTPEVKYVQQKGVSDGTGARVVAVADTLTAVYVPTPKPRVDIVDFAEERRRWNDRRVHLLGPRLTRTLQETVESGAQALILLLDVL